MQRVCVVGTGYVGLVTGTCLADLGHDVVCLDVVEEKIARLQRGDLPIYEPGLEPLVRRNVAAGRLHFTTSYADACTDIDFVFIAVNTPTIPGGAGADMTYVERAARGIAQAITRDVIIVNKSTMPVGSGDLVSTIVREHLAQPSIAVAVVSNPEFLREGSAVEDFLHPDRVVLGSTDREAAERVAQLYLKLRAPIVVTDLYTAEMIKYASNAFLATKISFINEIARICDRLGADVAEVAAGMGYDRRIGRAFLNAGLGYGGSCFGKDVKALTHMAAEAGLHPQMLEAVMTINDDQRHIAVAKLAESFGGAEALRGKVVALLGLAFKDNTDDMRDAPAIDIVRWLTDLGVEVRAYDPVAHDTAREALAEAGVSAPITYCADEYDAARGAQAILVVTEWQRFRTLDFARLAEVMAPEEAPVLIDGRNLYNPAEIRRLGFHYLGVGRGTERQPGMPNGHAQAQPAQTQPAQAAVRMSTRRGASNHASAVNAIDTLNGHAHPHGRGTE